VFNLSYKENLYKKLIELRILSELLNQVFFYKGNEFLLSNEIKQNWWKIQIVD